MITKRKKQLFGILRHALTLLSFFINKIFFDLNWLQFAEIGSFWRIFLMTFFAAFVARGVESFQGLVYGANKTPEERKDMWNDIIVSTVAGFIGAFGSEWYFNLWGL